MSRRRILHASVEIAGVARALRDGQRARGDRAETWMLVPHPFVPGEDRLIQGWVPRIRAAVAAPLRFDVLHYHAGNTLLEHLEIAWARLLPLRRVAVMHYWGDDVRVRLGTELEPEGADEEWRRTQAAAERVVRRRLHIARRLAHAAVVSDLELAAHARRWFSTVYLVPTPLALPAGARAPQTARRPGPVRVLHAPSDRLLKGTASITAAVERVATRHDVELVLLSGVPREEVVDHLRDADLVVDQLGSVTTGVLALESMALGRPVLVQYDRELLAPFARDTPAVPVTADSLEATIEALVSDADRRRALGAAGRAFVARTHDLEQVCASMEQVYRHARRAPAGLFSAGPDGIERVAG